MSAVPKPAQRQLGEIVRSLETIRFHLIGVEATLPPSPAETDRLQDVGTEDTDPVTALRSAIQCALKDSLEPLIGDLRNVAALVTPEPEEEDG